VRFAGAVYVLHALEEVPARHRHAEGGVGPDRAAAQASEGGLRAIVKKRENEPGAEATTEIPVTPSSGNVFADLGFAEPEEELTKAQLASHIRQVIRRRRLTQMAAAALMGIDQPKVSALLNGRLANFSSERLMRLLTTLGQDVDITVKPRNRARGRIRVIDAAHP
jgi:predicted XRE-type DNA-binding protein